MENIVIPVLWVVVAINVVLGFVIFSRGIKNPRNIFFGVIAFSSALWSFSIIAFYNPDIYSSVNWLDYTHLSALCVAFVFFIFSFLFPKSLSRSSISIIFGTFAFFLASYFIIFTDYIVGSRIADSVRYVLTEGYVTYSLLIIVFFLAGYAFLFLQYRRANNIDEKQQVKYVLFGSMIASVFALVPDLIMPYLGNFDYTWLGPLFTLIMVFSIFMAMAKFHLFNVKIIITELFSGLIIFVLLVDLFSAQTTTDLLIKAVIIMLVTIVSFLLVRSVYREVNQREKIEQLATQLEDFIHFLSHEVKGILGKNRLMFQAMIDKDFGEITPKLEPLVKQSLTDTTSSVNMVMNILQSSDIKNGKLVMNKQPFDFRQAIVEVVNEFRPEVEKKGIQLELDLDGIEKCTVNGDKENIVKHVIKNLLLNSITYTPSGKIIVGLKPGKEGTVRFFVKDTGLGISEHTKAKLFTEGGKGEESSKINVHSTGYGLYFAKGIVDAHNGKIWAESEGEGKGATFYVELKCV